MIPVESAVGASVVYQKLCVTVALILARHVVCAMCKDRLICFSQGLVNVLDGALCVGVFTALAPGLVGLLLMDRPLSEYASHGSFSDNSTLALAWPKKVRGILMPHADNACDMDA